MMKDLRRRYKLSERDPLPQAVLDTLKDAPGLPPSSPQHSAFGKAVKAAVGADNEFENKLSSLVPRKKSRCGESTGKARKKAPPT